MGFYTILRTRNASTSEGEEYDLMRDGNPNLFSLKVNEGQQNLMVTCTLCGIHA